MPQDLEGSLRRPVAFGADAVLDAGVDAVAGFQAVQLPAGGVGGQDLVAVAVVLLEQGDLHPGRDRLTAHDALHVLGPLAELVGDLAVGSDGLA